MTLKLLLIGALLSNPNDYLDNLLLKDSNGRQSISSDPNGILRVKYEQLTRKVRSFNEFSLKEVNFTNKESGAPLMDLDWLNLGAGDLQTQMD